MRFNFFILTWAGSLPDEILYYIHQSFQCDTNYQTIQLASLQLYPLLYQYNWYVYSEQHANKCEEYLEGLRSEPHFFSYERKMKESI
jgi:hypothetical protein